MQDETDILLRVTVDRLAQVKATIATLQDEEAALRAALVAAASGRSVFRGTEHRATVLLCEGKVTTNWRAIAEHFSPSYQLVTAHTTQGEPYTVVRLSAHKTSK